MDNSTGELPHVPKRLISRVEAKVKEATFEYTKREAANQELKSTGAAYSVFKPNTYPPRAELWDVGTNLTSTSHLWAEMLWDLKEVFIFFASTIAWIAERYEDSRLSEAAHDSYKTDVAYYTMGAIISVAVVLFAIVTYDEMSRRKRMYYIYLLIDVFIDFENIPAYRKKRFYVVCVLAAILYWTGFSAGQDGTILRWHNLDGLINIYGLVYFVTQTMDVEDGLVPFSKIFEREDGRRLITKGWDKLRLVDEEMIVAYVLLRCQQISWHKKQVVKESGHAAGEPSWMASRDDLVYFLKHEYTMSPEEHAAVEAAGRDIGGADADPDNDSALDLDVANMPKRRMLAGKKATVTTISGYSWRKHYWGFWMGHLVINRNCVFGKFEEKDEQIDFFHALEMNRLGLAQRQRPNWSWGAAGAAGADSTFVGTSAPGKGGSANAEAKGDLDDNAPPLPDQDMAIQWNSRDSEEHEEEEHDGGVSDVQIEITSASPKKNKTKKQQRAGGMRKSSSKTLSAGRPSKRTVSKSPQRKSKA